MDYWWRIEAAQRIGRSKRKRSVSRDVGEVKRQRRLMEVRGGRRARRGWRAGDVCGHPGTTTGTTSIKERGGILGQEQQGGGDAGAYREERRGAGRSGQPGTQEEEEEDQHPVNSTNTVA